MASRVDLEQRRALVIADVERIVAHLQRTGKRAPLASLCRALHLTSTPQQIAPMLRLRGEVVQVPRAKRYLYQARQWVEIEAAASAT